MGQPGVRIRWILPTKGYGAQPPPHIAGSSAQPLVHAPRCAFLTGVVTNFISFHFNLETLIRILAGHMRFVPAHKQSNNDTTSFSPATWPVEMVLISNEDGIN